MKSAEEFLSKLGERIDTWRARIAGAGAEAKRQGEAVLEQLSQKKDAVSRKLRELKDASAQTWQEVRPDLQAALDDLKRAYEKAATRFRDNGQSQGDADGSAQPG